jgi:hypothetical protein
MSCLGLESLEKIAIEHVKTERSEKLNEGIDTLKDLMKNNLGEFLKVLDCVFFVKNLGIKNVEIPNLFGSESTSW